MFEDHITLSVQPPEDNEGNSHYSGDVSQWFDTLNMEGLSGPDHAQSSFSDQDSSFHVSSYLPQSPLQPSLPDFMPSQPPSRISPPPPRPTVVIQPAMTSYRDHNSPHSAVSDSSASPYSERALSARPSSSSSDASNMLRNDFGALIVDDSAVIVDNPFAFGVPEASSPSYSPMTSHPLSSPNVLDPRNGHHRSKSSSDLRRFHPYDQHLSPSDIPSTAEVSPSSSNGHQDFLTLPQHTGLHRFNSTPTRGRRGRSPAPSAPGSRRTSRSPSGFGVFPVNESPSAAASSARAIRRLRASSVGSHSAGEVEGPFKDEVGTDAMEAASSKRRETPANFQCDTCAKTFTTKFAKERHENNHKGKRYKCLEDDCPNTFGNPSDMKRHWNNKHKLATPSSAPMPPLTLPESSPVPSAPPHMHAPYSWPRADQPHQHSASPTHADAQFNFSFASSGFDSTSFSSNGSSSSSSWNTTYQM